MKLYSLHHALSQDPFGLFDEIVNIENSKELKQDGILLLHGGEDISPTYYNERPIFTNASHYPTKRDLLEQTAFEYAVNHNIPIIGICRGAQLACCLSGGSLWQHVEGHLCNHNIHTIDNKLLQAAADHHQAMRLESLDVMKNTAELAESMQPTKAFSQDHPNGIGLRSVLEVVYFKNTNCLAIQPHPEWMSPDTPFNKWCAKQIKTYLFKEYQNEII